MFPVGQPRQGVKSPSVSETDSVAIFRVPLVTCYNETWVEASIKIDVFWDVTPCNLEQGHLFSEETAYMIKLPRYSGLHHAFS